MSCYEMRVREFVARTAVAGTGYGRPRDLNRLLGKPATAIQRAPLEYVARTLEAMNQGIRRDSKFDVRPSVTQLETGLVTATGLPQGRLIERTDEASRKLIDLVEGFSTVIRDAVAKDTGMKTAEPNSHELEESIVDGLLIAVGGTEGEWTWQTMRGSLQRAIVEQLLQPKGEADFPGSVFLEEDRARLLPLLERVRIGDRNLFDGLQEWYDTHAAPLAIEAGHTLDHATGASAGWPASTGTTPGRREGNRG